MKQCYVLLLLAITFTTSQAQTGAVSPAGFIENKGQIVDQNFKPNPHCLFLLNGTSKVQLTKKGFSYEIIKVDVRKLETGKIKTPNRIPAEEYISHVHRVDVILQNASWENEVMLESPSAGYNNYYLPHAPNGILNVNAYTKVTYINVYPNIDVEFIADVKTGFKYNFIVRPGGDYRNIKLQYLGADKTEIVNDEIHIVTTNGNFNESIPVSYMAENNRKINVTYRQISENVFGFIAPQLTYTDKTLIIDPYPDIIWGTYYGGIGGVFGDRGLDIDLDASDNSYSIGMTTSTSGIATAGAHQTTYTSGVDAYLVKFNSAGVRQWGTYVGTFGADKPEDVKVDNAGFIYICGTSQGTSANISTAGSHQQTNAGGQDAYLMKFNTSGVRQWGTYYGGFMEDYGYAIAIDASNNVFLGGATESTAGIATAGAHNTAHSAWNDLDGFLVKFNSSGVRQWGTYYTGDGDDFVYTSATDAAGNVYIGGSTTSTTGIASAGAYQTTHGGSGSGYDIFCVKFNTNGVRQWGTYYGGVGTDEAFGMVAEPGGNVYLTGQADYDAAFTTAGAHQTTYGFTNDAYLLKFSSTGARLYCTYYGGNGWDFGNDLCLDDSLNVYIGGFSWATNNISSANVYQTVHGDGGTGEDGFIAKFNSAGVRKWGTYYGGAAWETVEGIKVSDSYEIYVTGYGGDCEVTPGAYQTTPSGAIIAKFGNSTPINCTGFSASISSSVNASCNGDNDGSATANGTGSPGPYTYSWNTTPAQTTQTATGLSAGTYNAVVTAANGCDDTISVTITEPAPVQASFTTTQNGNMITFNNTSSPGTYLWDYGDGSFSYTPDPVYCFCFGGTYNVCLTVYNPCDTVTTCQNLTVNGLTEEETMRLLAVHPNPFTSQVSFMLPTEARVDVYSAVGDMVFSEKRNPGVNQLTLDFLQTGMYFMQVTAGTENYRIKLIKQ